jgi:hypothetical protein
MTIDDLLCNASEAQLRNVLALTNLTDVELAALFEREAQMSTREQDAEVIAQDETFARQIGIALE